MNGEALEELVEGSVLTLTRLSMLHWLSAKPMKSGAHILYGHPLALVNGITDNAGAAI